jgi:NAD(P)-dependent dehydrogenase (short-subunit alcohol dehydrogenase family)
MPDLTNLVALVTGSTSGIGRGIAEHFGSLGARLVIHGRNAEGGEAVTRALREAGREAVFVAGDLQQEDACRTLVRRTIEYFGQIDVLVNNAALTSRGSIESTGVGLWDVIMAVNLRAPFVLMQEAVRDMKTRSRGSIVNIGSINAYIGEPKLCPYSVSKGGLMTLTRNAAAALGPYRIRVNQLNVGWTLTEGEERVKREEEHRGDEWLPEAIKTRPFGRLLQPLDIASAAAYFASDDSAVVSGAILDVEQFPVGAPENR